MWGYYLLGKIILYVIVLIAVGILTRIVFKSGKVALVAVVITATIPWWDFYPRWFKHQELCELDGGYRVYRTVPEGVSGYFDGSSLVSPSSDKSYRWILENQRYDYLEAYRRLDSNLYKIYIKDEEAIFEKIDQPESIYEAFVQRSVLQGWLPYDQIKVHYIGVKNRRTGEILSSENSYGINNPWGWYFSFPDSSVGCRLGPTKVDLFYSQVIPSKSAVKEKQHDNS